MTRATSKAAFLHMQETGKAATKCRQILAYVEAHLFVNPERLAA